MPRDSKLIPVKAGNRIAIFNAHWHVHSNVAYMVTALARAGYCIDVFLYCADERLSGSLLAESKAVTVHRFGKLPVGKQPATGTTCATGKLPKLTKYLPPPPFRGWLRELKEWALLRFAPSVGLIPHAVTQKILNICKGNSYLALIGVEKGGLGLAGAIANRLGAPLVYYSLELYTWDHHWVIASRRMKRFKLIEEHYHPQCALTIVQDKQRGEALLKSNQVSNNMPMAYLPISLSGPINTSPSQWLQNQLGVGVDEVLILSYGMMSQRRRCIDLVRIAQVFPENWKIVFHGYGPRELIDQMLDVDKSRRICISDRIVPAEEREEVVRSATVGLAIYDNESLNDKLTGFSSEKVAVYLKCGVPIIALRHSSYQHIEDEGAAVLVDELEDIPRAVQIIIRNYARYRASAYRCFQRYYKFEQNFAGVIKALTMLQSGRVRSQL